jgi:hypothetical protein
MRRSILTTILTLLLVGSAVLAADDKAVRVSVVAILATERDNKIDRKLESIATEIKKMYPKLTGFQLAHMSCKSVPVGTADKFDLVADQTVPITVQRKADKSDRVRLEVTPPLMGKITYSTPCGKFLPIVTPYRTKNNDLLIIAIRVQPCHGK